MDAILKTGMRRLVRNRSLRIHNAAATRHSVKRVAFSRRVLVQGTPHHL